MQKTSFFLSLLLIVSVVYGHAILNDPEPRTDNDNLTNGPCGNTDPGNPTTTLEPGTRTIDFDATIPHAGEFLISLSINPDQEYDIILAENIEASRDQENFQIDVQIPDIDCQNCAIQMIQQANIGPDYYSCADVIINGSQDPQEYLRLIQNGEIPNGDGEDDDDDNNTAKTLTFVGIVSTLGLGALTIVIVLGLIIGTVIIGMLGYKYYTSKNTKSSNFEDAEYVLVEDEL
eukprot:TRINITY_DN13153_c0_g1_i1.p1 TRINITY_DN13153_c0_g1~~TRINITY_DN13153_c0_g1_i1.p1  ORF type:complete len:232 (+),score=79.52 TRINITY_DN13153_c0_g1_i1:62-757(+)